MTVAASDLQVNLFPTEFSQPAVLLSRMYFEDQDQATRYLQSLPREAVALRGVRGSTGIPIYLLGPTQLNAAPPVDIRLADDPDLSKKLIDTAAREFFAGRGLLVRRDLHGSLVLHANPILERGDVVIRTGVAVHARRPFAADPEFFVLAASWQTQAEFKQSLSAEILRSMATGQEVIYKPPRSSHVDPELRKFVRRRLGVVVEITQGEEAVVQCVDHSTRLLPLAYLYLEAGPHTLTEYDRRIGNRTSSLWLELLKANFTLSGTGRRNTRVLRDRLTAVQRFLGGRGDVALEIPVHFCNGLKVNVDLRPLTATYG